ncbi:MAG: response regulator [Limnohabitans sp.]
MTASQTAHTDRPDGIVRVLIADDHAMVRDGLSRILASEPGIAVVGQAWDGASTLQQLEQSACNILLMDMAMPPPRGPELIKAVHALRPELPILVISMYDQTGIVLAAIQAGAKGYLTKGADPETLISAVRQVAAGEQWLDPVLAKTLVLGQQRQAPLHEHLSTRERQVMGHLLAGDSNQQIAAKLELSEKTISTHKTNILSKLNVTSIAGLVQYAQEHLLADILSVDPGQPR